MTKLAKILHLIIIGRGCTIDLVLLALTLFSSSDADPFFKNMILSLGPVDGIFPNLQLRCIY